MRVRDAILITLCVLAIGTFGLFAIRHVVLDLPREVLARTHAGMLAEASALAERIRTSLNIQPEITSGGQTLVRGDRAVMQLVTVERELVTQHTWSHTWLGSRKVLRLEGDFTARAGIPLNGRIQIDIDSKTGKHHVTVPDAEIFSVDLKALRVLEDEDGFWNKINAAEREQAIRELQTRARTSLADSDLVAMATRRAVEQVDALVQSATRPTPVFTHELPVDSQPVRN